MPAIMHYKWLSLLQSAPVLPYHYLPELALLLLHPHYLIIDLALTHMQVLAPHSDYQHLIVLSNSVVLAPPNVEI